MINLSLSGCGFLGIYHVGVISAFREHANDLLKEKISGCSAGALVAACAMCDCCLGQMVSDVLEIALKARSYSLGPLHPSFSIVDILRNGLRRILPVDAHKICSGRVHVSLTRWRDGKHFLVNHFESREDLIQALICSSFVPAYSGLIPPKFRGTYFWDGGLSNNSPILDQDTIIVSPFGGEADICPRDESGSYFCHDFQGTNLQWSYENIYRLSKALFPPNPEVLKAICFRGYKDAINFLKSRNLLQCSCNRAWEMKSINSMFGEHLNGFENSIVNEEDEMEVDDASDVYDSEEDNLLQYANNQPLAYQEMPASVCAILDAACNDSKGIINLIYDSQLSRAISILVLPWTLPIEFCMNFTRRVLEMVPKLNVPANPSFFHTLIVFFNYAIQKFTYDRYQYHARVTCKLCNMNSTQCCHGNGLSEVANVVAANSAVGCVQTNMALVNKSINIINATPSTTNGSQTTNVDGVNSMTASLNYMGASSYYYYPKMCARHRVPSVCSSETTGVASGSFTSASASIRFHRRRRHNQTGSTRRSISGAASNASDLASSVDLNEYRSSKLSKRRSSRSMAFWGASAARSLTESNVQPTMSSRTYPNSANSQLAASHNLDSNNSDSDYKRSLMSVEKMNSGVAIADSINSKVNMLLNSTPMSTPPTPSGHKVHFHLNYTTDDDDGLSKVAKNHSLDHQVVVNTNPDSSSMPPASAPRAIVKNSAHPTPNKPPNDNEMLLEWESYWDSLEYNCLGRINLDF